MIDASIIREYFPGTDNTTIEKLINLESLYKDWNSRINVISRKDIGNFGIHHLLHSLSIARFISFKPGTTILDAGTGGGFPGIPLAIMFPEASFTLVDSIAKKIKVVEAICNSADVLNVTPVVSRVENLKTKYDFIVSRAVTAFPTFVSLTSNHIGGTSFNNIENGIIYLKGGDFISELGRYKERVTLVDIKNYFKEEFFLEKRIIHLAGSKI